MKNRTFLCTLLAGALWLGVATPADACKYCRAAADPEGGADPAMFGGRGSDAFPLEASIDKFQPSAAPANLTVPPAAASVATSAADLPAPLAARRPAAVAAALAPVPPPATAAKPALGAAQTHVLDGSLLGLAALGGVFCWRSRKPGVKSAR